MGTGAEHYINFVKEDAAPKRKCRYPKHPSALLAKEKKHEKGGVPSHPREGGVSPKEKAGSMTDSGKKKREEQDASSGRSGDSAREISLRERREKKIPRRTEEVLIRTKVRPKLTQKGERGKNDVGLRLRKKERSLDGTSHVFNEGEGKRKSSRLEEKGRICSEASKKSKDPTHQAEEKKKGKGGKTQLLSLKRSRMKGDRFLLAVEKGEDLGGAGSNKKNLRRGEKKKRKSVRARLAEENLLQNKSMTTWTLQKKKKRGGAPLLVRVPKKKHPVPNRPGGAKS